MVAIFAKLEPNIILKESIYLGLFAKDNNSATEFEIYVLDRTASAANINIYDDCLIIPSLADSNA